MTVGDWLSVIVARLVREFEPLQVILFGSQATGEARLDSDIDLLVVLPQLDHKRNTAVAMLRLLSDVPIPVDVIPTDPEEITRRGQLVGTVLRGALQNGKVLYDRAE